MADDTLTRGRDRAAPAAAVRTAPPSSAAAAEPAPAPAAGPPSAVDAAKARHSGEPGSPESTLLVDIVVPTHDDASGIERSIRSLHAYLTERFPFSWRITIADNGSRDTTPEIARRLARELPGVEASVRAEPGRGGALRAAWTGSKAEVVAYMDVDLSTDLDALLPLVAPLLSGHSDVAIGSRLAAGARTSRGPKREIISRCYNRLLHAVLRTRFRDAQCGFKALRAETARRLLPAVVDDGWFFDTELLVRAQRDGLRIMEIPVDWIDDPDSRVAIMKTALADLGGVWRLLTGRGGPRGRHHHVVRFATVGIASTIAYLLAFLALRPALGPWWANALALAGTAVLNTAANRRYTFGIAGPKRRARHHAQGLVAFAIGLAASNVGLAALHWLSASAPAAVEGLSAFAAGAVATSVRYLLFRHWIFAGVVTNPTDPSDPSVEAKKAQQR